MTTSVQGELFSADQAELMVRSISLQMIVFEVTLEIKEEDGRVCFLVIQVHKTLLVSTNLFYFKH